MKSTRWIYSLIVILMAGFGQAEAEEEKQTASTFAEEVVMVAVEKEEVVIVDAEWLDEVWTQIDEVVAHEELTLQVTTTVSGVRGAEAEDEVLNMLYYKGSPDSEL
jgi:hypothetical protein